MRCSVMVESINLSALVLILSSMVVIYFRHHDTQLLGAQINMVWALLFRM